jgi:hypothetical protein
MWTASAEFPAAALDGETAEMVGRVVVPKPGLWRQSHTGFDRDDVTNRTQPTRLGRSGAFRSNFLVSSSHKRIFVVWSANGSVTDLETAVVSATELTTNIPAALLHDPVIAAVSVVIEDVMSDGAPRPVNSVRFTVQ